MDVTRFILWLCQALPGPEAEGWLDTPSHVGAEQTIQNPVPWLKLGVETLGAPARIMLDNGPEFTSKALDAWAYAHPVS